MERTNSKHQIKRAISIENFRFNFVPDSF